MPLLVVLNFERGMLLFLIVPKNLVESLVGSATVRGLVSYIDNTRPFFEHLLTAWGTFVPVQRPRIIDITKYVCH